MYYELYADSLWLLNFVMNLYLLILADKSLLRTATRRRIIAGAAAGAALYLLPFWWRAPFWVKYPFSVLFGTAVMVFIAFRPGNLRAFARILEKLFWYAFLMGGALLFLTESLPFLRGKFQSVCGVAGLGAGVFLLAGYLQENRRRREKRNFCRATLVRNGNTVCVEALLDSGNSLAEPISGKPVSVIDEKLYRALWPEEDVPYRVVPYRSIGKKRGLLRGFVLPELRVEVDGMTKRFSGVYVAVSAEYAGDMRMILNPALFDRAESVPERNAGLE